MYKRNALLLYVSASRKTTTFPCVITIYRNPNREDLRWLPSVKTQCIASLQNTMIQRNKMIKTTSISLLYNNKYRIPSARLHNWNYANEAMYFITICTKNRKKYFGEIDDSRLQTTDIGKIAYTEWYKTIELRSDMKLESGEFVVMPNHIHGIITIGVNEYNTGNDTMHCGSTEYQNQFAPQSKNLSATIRGYKSSVTTFARKNGILFDWQPRFHDHIIRSMDEYQRISNYILNNPAQWQNDTFYQI